MKTINSLPLKYLNKFILFIFIFITHNLYAKTDKTFDFGLYLYNKQEYFRAISEFERFIFFSPKNKLVLKAKFLIGKSYYKAKLYNQAYNYFSELENDKKYRYKALFCMGDSLFNIGKYKEAFNIYKKIEMENEKLREKALYAESWASLLNYDFDITLDIYNKLKNSSEYNISYLKESVTKIKKFKKLSPYLAASLSTIIPGAGQFYAKRRGDGLVAFATVGTLTVSSYLLWRYYEYKEVAVIISLTDIFFYLGNIYSAFSSVQKYNRLYYKKNIDMLKNNYWTENDI